MTTFVTILLAILGAAAGLIGALAAIRGLIDSIRKNPVSRAEIVTIIAAFLIAVVMAGLLAAGRGQPLPVQIAIAAAAVLIVAASAWLTWRAWPIKAPLDPPEQKELSRLGNWEYCEISQVGTGFLGFGRGKFVVTAVGPSGAHVVREVPLSMKDNMPVCQQLVASLLADGWQMTSGKVDGYCKCTFSRPVTS